MNRFYVCASLLVTMGFADLPMEQIEAACVEILVDGRLDGSGCMIDTNGTILTAAHVLGKPGGKFEIQSNELGRRDVQVIAVDMGHDIALLRLVSNTAPTRVLRLAKSIPKVGESCWVHGTPLFRHGLTLKGTMARVRPGYEYLDQHFVECVYVNAMSPSGTSGGPWMNDQGEVFGVQNGGMTIGQAMLGISYIAPLPSIQHLLQSQTHARTPHINAAFEELSGQNRVYLRELPRGLSGMVLRQVQSGGIAARAGLREEDLMMSFNGKNYTRLESFMQVFRALQPGDRIQIKVVNRFGKDPRNVELQAGCLEADWAKP